MGHFDGLQAELEQYLEAEQVEQIHEAYLLGKEAHEGQTRRTGEPYITHPLAVAKIMAEMRMDPQSIMAAILHDVIEDTPVDKKSLEKKFGKVVAELVDGVSKLTQIKFESRAEAQAENFRKMVLAMAKDIRVILVKLADRLHNMRTLGALGPDKRRRIALETLEIYAPIANRLGMHNFRIEFEDLGFAALYPMRYRVLEEAVRKARGNRKEILSVIKKTIRECLDDKHFPDWKISGREKHLYSIYRKMRTKRIPFSEIMDVYAFRVVVDDIDTCYRVLGAVHNLYKPVPERFKDYIAIPKANGYQSLHTTLFGPYGVPIEIQIRTVEMNQMADTGIASHWLYKSGDTSTSKAHIRAQAWLSGLVELQQNTGSSLEFIENVKIDLFPDEVYVFTPKGNILELPNGASAVDFAYAIHTDIGNTCVAVKINRRLTPLSTQLSNGQTIEIITSPGARPNPAWLNFVVTGKARSNIRHFLKKQRRTESIALGTRLLERALSTMSLTVEDIPQQNIDTVLGESDLETFDDLLESIGLGSRVPLIVARRLACVEKAELDAEEAEKRTAMEQLSKQPLLIKGTEGMVINTAHCCHPIPGDVIVGLLDAGRGIIVHTEDCQQIKELRNTDKCIYLSWEDNIKGDFIVKIIVELINARGVLAALAAAVSDANANIENISVEEKDGRYCVVNLTLTVQDRVHLAKTMRRIRNLKEAAKITRIKGD
ncbi:MAG: bifunctional GTP diphosphokinase/guanosine-3',5'-bis(diphosphate) 3'-diphosphatase [Legionellales bacterium]|nr:bifunctional GTP diphosphokinase/guanosine-3',5'-bis(diphosphate) 3'-diphosphatase [Legionellales bacterium]